VNRRNPFATLNTNLKKGAGYEKAVAIFCPHNSRYLSCVSETAPKARVSDLISDALPCVRLWYDTPDNAIGYAMHSSRSHDAVIRVHDAADYVVEMH
jgi:hypothetical protein